VPCSSDFTAMKVSPPGCAPYSFVLAVRYKYSVPVLRTSYYSVRRTEYSLFVCSTSIPSSCLLFSSQDANQRAGYSRSETGQLTPLPRLQPFQAPFSWQHCSSFWLLPVTSHLWDSIGETENSKACLACKRERQPRRKRAIQRQTGAPEMAA
jgi:hypothetical protein